MKAWIDKLKLENFEHCFSRSMVRLFSFKKMTISTASISENKLSVAYLWKNGSMVIFGEYNTSPSRSDFNFAELWYSSLKKLPDDGPLYSSENWIKKNNTYVYISPIAVHISHVYFLRLLSATNKTVTIHLVKLFRCHACIITPQPGPPGFLFAGYRIATFITHVFFFSIRVRFSSP